MQFRLRGLTANGYRLPRRGGNLPPAKMRSIFLYFSAFTRDIIAAKPRANG